MITKKTEYAIRAMWELHQVDGGQTTSNSIAQRQSIPPKYLPQIISELSRVGLVVSSRGFGGGLRLNRSAQEITLLEIIEAIQGKLKLFECVSGGPSECPFFNSCDLKTTYSSAQSALEQVFGKTFLADLHIGKPLINFKSNVN